MIRVGDTITAPTPDGEVVTGEVVAQFDTDAEGRPLTGGPTLLVRTETGERPVKLGDAEASR